MSRRDSKMLWIRDTLEHLRRCQQQLNWTDNPDAVRMLTESMMRDLDRCRRLCEDLHNRVCHH